MNIHRQAFGAEAPTTDVPMPELTIERIPKTIDGCTWHVFTHRADGVEIGATGRTRKAALEEMEMKWAMFN